MQEAVKQLTRLAPTLIDDLDEGRLKTAGELIDQLVQPLAEDDIKALLSLLPSSGDTAYGLNWTILHAVEAAPGWPLWSALTDSGNEWTALLLIRLENGGYIQPKP